MNKWDGRCKWEKWDGSFRNHLNQRCPQEGGYHKASPKDLKYTMDFTV